MCCAIILQDHSNGNMFIQSLRHGCAAPPPFATREAYCWWEQTVCCSLCWRRLEFVAGFQQRELPRSTHIKGPLVQRGLAPRSGDWGIVSTIILQDHSNGNMFIQHGCAAPPPFTQGRLFFGEGLQYAISFCIRGDFGLCCVEVPFHGKTKKVPLLCGSGTFFYQYQYSKYVEMPSSV